VLFLYLASKHHKTHYTACFAVVKGNIRFSEKKLSKLVETAKIIWPFPQNEYLEKYRQHTSKAPATFEASVFFEYFFIFYLTAPQTIV